MNCSISQFRVFNWFMFICSVEYELIAEQKQQKLSEIKTGIDEADVLVTLGKFRSFSCHF